MTVLTHLKHALSNEENNMLGLLSYSIQPYSKPGGGGGGGHEKKKSNKRMTQMGGIWHNGFRVTISKLKLNKLHLESNEKQYNFRE
jgi:hypothetical protein